MGDQLQEDLLGDLRAISGLPLSNGNQCKQLSTMIFNATGGQISWQSLRRVLGFINSESQPTIYTMNVISRYLGFDSYNGYILSKQNKIVEQKSGSILDMMEITFNLHPRAEKDFNYHFVCRGLSRYYYDNYDLLLDLPKELYHYPSFQEYFIRRFPLLDLMDHGFKNILLQHPLLENNHEIKLFVYGAIYLHDYKSGNGETDGIKGLEAKETDGLHPFVIGRYYGLMLHLAFDNNHRSSIIEEVKSKLNSCDDQERMSILFTFLDYAIALEMYNEALDLLKTYKPTIFKFKKWIEFGYFEVFKIYHLYCLAKTGQIDEARLLSKSTSMIGVAFYFRKTYQLLFQEALILLEEDKKSKMLLEKELSELKKFLFIPEKSN